MSETARTMIVVGTMVFGAVTLAAGMSWIERRVLALWQDRYGPNRVGPFGIFQLVADMIKMFTKEDWVPPFADRVVFVLAPAIIIITALLSFAIIPVAPGFGVVPDMNVGVLFFLAMSSMGAYSVVLAGWSSNSKYSLLGGMRSAAQMLAYEVFMGISLMGVVMLAGSFSLEEIVRAQERLWFIVPQYLGMLVVSSLMTVLFLGGWQGPWLPPAVWFFAKTMSFAALFILIRATLPRPRFDQLMAWGWKLMLPLALLNLVATGAWVLAR